MVMLCHLQWQPRELGERQVATTLVGGSDRPVLLSLTIQFPFSFRRGPGIAVPAVGHCLSDFLSFSEEDLEWLSQLLVIDYSVSSLFQERPAMAAPTVVTIQPQYGGAMSSVSRCTWQTGLMDCCTDCSVCECLGYTFLAFPPAQPRAAAVQPCSLALPAAPGGQAEPHSSSAVFLPCQAAAGCSASPAWRAKWPGT